MKNRLLLFLCALVVAAGAMAKDKLAVLPFSGGEAGEGNTIAELFSFTELSEVFSIIPHTGINQAVEKEQNFRLDTNMTDPDTAIALGKQLGARYVVSGSITALGDRKLLIIAILKIDEHRQIAGDFQTYAGMEEIQEKLPGMARNIIDAVTRPPPDAGGLAVTPVEMGNNTDSSVAETLGRILSIFLIRSGKYLVYPRRASLEQVQAEYDTRLSGETADEHAAGMGRGDTPRLVLFTGARRLGRRNMFNAAIIDLESGLQLTGRSVNYDTLDDGILVMEELARELRGESGVPGDRAANGEKKSRGAVFGYGALNLVGGLGSFIQRDWVGGATLLAGYGAAAGLIGWEVSLDYEDDLAGIPGTAGLVVAGLTAVYGFIRPVLYQRNRGLTERADRINLAVVPGEGGGTVVRLSYTLKF
ncbi:MAG: penicillin-binding protein activator LpoB [Treponema sp.]|nr:penicillin-binding protein activator LpoB [Treponema sp.]